MSNAANGRKEPLVTKAAVAAFCTDRRNPDLRCECEVTRANSGKRPFTHHDPPNSPPPNAENPKQTLPPERRKNDHSEASAEKQAIIDVAFKANLGDTKD